MDIDIEGVIGGMCNNKFQTEIKFQMGESCKIPFTKIKLWVSVFWKISIILLFTYIFGGS